MCYIVNPLIPLLATRIPGFVARYLSCGRGRVINGNHGQEQPAGIPVDIEHFEDSLKQEQKKAYESRTELLKQLGEK